MHHFQPPLPQNHVQKPSCIGKRALVTAVHPFLEKHEPICNISQIFFLSPPEQGRLQAGVSQISSGVIIAHGASTTQAFFSSQSTSKPLSAGKRRRKSLLGKILVQELSAWLLPPRRLANSTSKCISCKNKNKTAGMGNAQQSWTAAGGWNGTADTAPSPAMSRNVPRLGHR